MELRLRILLDGAKNSIIHVTGEGSRDSISVLSLSDLKNKPRSVKLQGLIYSFRDKCPATLWWEVLDKSPIVILPLDGRGKMTFEEFHPLLAPEGCLGISLEYLSPEPFFLMLDLEKA